MSVLRPRVLLPMAALSLACLVGLSRRDASGEEKAQVTPAAKVSAAPPAPAAKIDDATPVSASADEESVPRPVLTQDELRRRFPAFPAATTDLHSISDQMVASGVPMNVAYFETTASAAEILDFYAAHFDAKGWEIMVATEAHEVVPHPALSATDPDTLMQMSVMVMPGGEKGGSNTVILSLADVHPDEELGGEGDLPAYPGATPLAVRTTDNEITGYTVNFATSDQAEAVAAFYRKALHERGYGEVEVTGAPQEQGTEALLFAKENRRWQLRVMQDNGSTVVMAVGSIAGNPEEAQQ